MVAVALTAPMQATTTMDAATFGRLCTSGTSVHGTNATGQASEEIAVSVVRMRGDSAYKTAGNTEGNPAGNPIRRESANVPENANPIISAHHKRCVTHAGTCARSASRKNAPCGNRYPYAWFCNWPSGNSSVYICVARAKKRAGLTTKSSLVSAATCPGGCKNARLNAPIQPRIWARTTVGSRTPGRRAPRHPPARPGRLAPSAQRTPPTPARPQDRGQRR